jgi:hypothetical protein
MYSENRAPGPYWPGSGYAQMTETASVSEVVLMKDWERNESCTPSVAVKSKVVRRQIIWQTGVLRESAQNYPEQGCTRQL